MEVERTCGMQETEQLGAGTSPEPQIRTSQSAGRTTDARRHRWGVILAGGDGTRLQSLTRLACGDDRPKQFCPLLGGKTLLAHTRQRLASRIAPDRMLFVLTRKHERFYEEELNRVAPLQKVIQPRNRGTLPAILWTLLRLHRTDANALVGFFPSDHYFARQDQFVATIDRTFDYLDRMHDAVILLGSAAERPETQYGWIEPEYGDESALDGKFTRVRCFWEKPSQPVALELFEKGCLWNTFVMMGHVKTFLDMIRRASPGMFDRFDQAISARTELADEEQSMRRVYNDLETADFSKAVLARSANQLLVTSCGNVGWSDLGEPRRFIEALLENGIENPWAAAEVCNVCGLKKEQIDTSFGIGRADGAVPVAMVPVQPSAVAPAALTSIPD